MLSLKGEQLVIYNLLNSQNIDDKIDGINRTIIAMSIGKNVQALF